MLDQHVISVCAIRLKRKTPTNTNTNPFSASVMMLLTVPFVDIERANSLRSLSNDDVSANDKKTIGLDGQNNNFVSGPSNQ